MISKWIQNSLLAFAMACLVSILFKLASFSIMSVKVFHVSVIWSVLFIVCLFVAEDVRKVFKKVLWFEKRKDKRPIWQVGVGAIFFVAQISFVGMFMPAWSVATLGGMPLYLVFSFMNAFLITVIYEEIFYEKSNDDSSSIKIK